jgi:hypothetical protein
MSYVKRLNAFIAAEEVAAIFQLFDRHRWARLLKQQRSITVYRYSSPTKENKLPFSVRFKQTEVAIFR